MQMVNLWLPQVFAHPAIVIKACVGGFCSSDAGGAGTHHNANAMRAYLVRQGVYSIEQSILLQSHPGKLIVATLQLIQAFGYRTVFDVIDATDPGFQITAVKIILAKPAAPFRKRLAQLNKTNACC
jgi:hypothetical protein